MYRTVRSYWVWACLMGGLCTGCEPAPPPPDPAHVAEIETWHQARLADLTGEAGWLNLAGLFWLPEGPTPFGTDAAHPVVLPEGTAPATVGTFVRTGEVVQMHLAPGVTVQLDSTRVEGTVTLYPGGQGATPRVRLGPLMWYVLQRGARIGVRVRHLDHPAVAAFEGIDRYPVDGTWRVRATLEPYADSTFIRITNVLGDVNASYAPGVLVFEKDGGEYRITPVIDTSTNDYFLIFADATNGAETYNAGRYLHAPFVDASGQTYLDFNQAYNPPCAFTEYATCPLPPEGNRLALAVEAGEKKWAGDLH